MKFRVMMKDPDVLHDAIEDAAKEEVASIVGINDDEREHIVEKRRERLSEFAGKWWEYGEYLTVELDTEAGTAVVVPRR